MALGGISLALTLVFLFGASVVPGAELTLYAISSLFVAVMMMETGLKGGISLYAASVILGFLILPNKVGMLPYVCLFGYYGILKYYIEKVKHPAGQLFLKILFFAAVLAAGLFLLDGLLLGGIQLPQMPIAVILIAGILFLLLYDVIYTLLIRIYKMRFKKNTSIRFDLSKKEKGQNHAKHE